MRPARACRLGLADGRTVSVRAIRPDDADRLRAFDGALSDTSRRRRYLCWMPPMSPEQALACATVDGVRRIALVAVRGRGHQQRMVADCRLIAMPGPERRAEVAIAVAEDHQGRGLGRALLRLALEAAAGAGFAAVVAQVRYDNETMLHLLPSLGFERTAWEMGVVTFTRALLDPRASRHLAGAGRRAR